MWSVLTYSALRELPFAFISNLDLIRNGRATIKVLCAQYEGKLAMSPTKAQVYAMIECILQW